MLAESADRNNPSDVTRIVYRGGFEIVEAVGQRQFAKARLLGPQGRAMTGDRARNLSGFVDVGWPQWQGDYFVVIRNTVRAIRCPSPCNPEQAPGLQGGATAARLFIFLEYEFFREAIHTVVGAYRAVSLM